MKTCIVFLFGLILGFLVGFITGAWAESIPEKNTPEKN